MKINYKPSTSHWLFPPIIMWILAILIVIMLIQRALRCKKNGTPFFNFKGYHFFVKNADYLRLFGTLILFALYTLLMPIMGFLAASILFVFLFNVLYCGVNQLKEACVAVKTHQVKGSKAVKSLVISLCISVVASLIIWLVFGVIFKITLP